MIALDFVHDYSGITVLVVAAKPFLVDSLQHLSRGWIANESGTGPPGRKVRVHSVLRKRDGLDVDLTRTEHFRQTRAILLSCGEGAVAVGLREPNMKITQ